MRQHPDLRELAPRRLPKGLFDFIDRGVGAEDTQSANEAALRSWDIVPKVGVDIGGRSSAATMLSRPLQALIKPLLQDWHVKRSK